MTIKNTLTMALSITALFMLSINTNANIETLNAIVKNVNPYKQTISFKDIETGKTKTLKYNAGARYINRYGERVNINEADKGEAVTLKLRKIEANGS